MEPSAKWLEQREKAQQCSQTEHSEKKAKDQGILVLDVREAFSHSRPQCSPSPVLLRHFSANALDFCMLLCL